MLLYPLSFSNACIAPIIQYLFPLVIGTSSLVYSDAPTSSIASTRSVTFGSKSSNFKKFQRFKKFNVQISKFQIGGLVAFGCIFQCLSLQLIEILCNLAQ